MTDKRKLRKNIEFEVAPSFMEGSKKLDKLECLRINKLKTLFFLLLLNIFFPLLIYWSVKLRRYLIFSSCELKKASFFYLKNQDNTVTVSKSRMIVVKKSHNEPLKYVIGFNYRSLNYYLEKEKQVFKVLELEIQINYNEILTKYGAGLTPELYEEYKKAFGKCSIDIKVPSLFQSFMKEIISPINAFQIFSIALWFVDQYYIYASVVLFLSIVSAFLNLSIIRSHIKNLSTLVKHENFVEVVRVINYKKEKQRINSTELVPGDVIILSKNLTLPCDCLLLTEKVIIDEINLTGEATAKNKFAIPYCEKIYNFDDSYHTLLEGSEIVQILGVSEDTALGLVIRTGFYGLKGEIFRNIIYSSNNRLSYLKVQMIKYFLIMLFLAVLGNVLKLCFRSADEELDVQIYEYFDLITVAVAPALPTCIFIAISISLIEMKKKNINCYSPYKLLSAGSITDLLIDKTGTLTEKHVELKEVHIFYNGANYGKLFHDSNKLLSFKKSRKIKTVENMDNVIEVVNCMSTCHNLYLASKEKGELKKELYGDMIDLEFFKYSNSEIFFDIGNDNNSSALRKRIEKPLFSVLTQGFQHFDDNENKFLSSDQSNPQKIFSLKIFEFTTTIKRMSIIAYNETKEEFRLYSKGSVESITSLCKKDSIPDDLNKRVVDFSKEGHIILGMAYKKLHFEKVSELDFVHRNELEIDLTFLGIILFLNPLKTDTAASILELSKSGINLKIITGDSAFTGLAVANSLNLIKNISKTVYLDMEEYSEEDSKLVIIENPLYFNGKPSIHEFPLFSKMVQKDSEINYERMFFLKGVSNSAEDFTSVSFTKSCSSQRKQIFSSHVNFLSKFFNFLEERIIEDVVMTGKIFNYLFIDKFQFFSNEEQKILCNLLKKIKVLGRMGNNDKTNLVLFLQNSSFIVGMIGDGLNDVGALKQADAGLALSSYELGLSSSFSTTRSSLTSFLDLLLESRKTVSSIIHTFKFISLYSLMQFSLVTLLNILDAGITDNQYLVQDLPVVTLSVILLSFTRSNTKLAKDIPYFDIFSLQSLFSMVGGGLIQLGSQITMLMIVRNQSWFNEDRMMDEEEYSYYEYCASCADGNAVFLCITMVMINGLLTTGNFYPNRNKFYKNYLFVLYFLVIHIYFSLVILYQPSRMEWLDLKDNLIDQSFLYVIFGASWIITFVLWFWEAFVCNILINKLIRKIQMKKMANFRVNQSETMEIEQTKKFKIFLPKNDNL